MARAYAASRPEEEPVFIRPQWGPKVEALKAKVRQIEDAERELLDEFQQRELGAAGELEDLEVLYTEDMERIREKDLLDKEALLKQLLAARRRAMQQAVERRRLEQEKAMEEDLMSQARELRRQLTRKEEDLVTTFRKREMQLEEELHRVKGQVADRDADAGLQQAGLDVVNVTARGGGCKVLRTWGLAEASGLRNADVITNVTTATDVKGKEDVGHLLESARPDEQMMLVLLRDNREVQVVVTVGRR
eukprot:EG_transcript_25689